MSAAATETGKHAELRCARLSFCASSDLYLRKPMFSYPSQPDGNQGGLGWWKTCEDELTVRAIMPRSSVGVRRSPGDFTQRADSWEMGNIFVRHRETNVFKPPVESQSSQCEEDLSRHWSREESQSSSSAQTKRAEITASATVNKHLMTKPGRFQRAVSAGWLNMLLVSQPRSTCLLNLVEAHSVRVALMEAVGVSEGLQRRDRGQDVTQAHGLPQQPQSDQGTRPPKHLHGPLLAAALQAHAIHLGEGKTGGGGRRMKKKSKQVRKEGCTVEVQNGL